MNWVLLLLFCTVNVARAFLFLRHSFQRLRELPVTEHLVGTSNSVNLPVDGTHSSRYFSGFVLAPPQSSGEPLDCGGASSQPTHQPLGSGPQILISVSSFLFSLKYFLLSLTISSLIQLFLRSKLLNFQIFVDFVDIFHLASFCCQ